MIRLLMLTGLAAVCSFCNAAIAGAGELLRLEGHLMRWAPEAAGGKTVSTKVHRRRADLWGLFGKNEPKVNSPTGAGNQDFHVVGSYQLVFDDPPVGTTNGYVSKVSVGKTDCVFPAPPSDAARLAFRVRIQPKIDQ